VTVTQQLLNIAVYLPFGLLFATIALELFAAKRRSTESNNAVIAALKASALGIAIACGAAFYVESQKIGGVSVPFGDWKIGLGVFGLVILALILKVVCRSKNIKSLPSKLTRARTKGGAGYGAKAALLGSYRVVLIAAFAGLFASMLLIKSEVKATPAVAENEKIAVEPEPAVAKVDPMPEPEPEPVVAVVEPEPTPEPEPVVTPEPMVEPVVAATTPDPANPFNSPDAVDVEPEMATEPTAEPEMVVAKVEPTPESEPMVTPTATPAVSELEKTRSDYYATLIQPLFRGRCYDCHAGDKKKGGLLLDTPDNIRAGGKSGPILVPGNPEKSHLLDLVSLPEDDPDVMPSKGRPLTTAQVGYIRRWIADGADLGDKKSWPGMEGKTFVSADAAASTLTPELVALMDKLKVSEVGIKEVAGQPGLYEIDYSHAGRAEGQLNLQELEPLAPYIYTLDLKKTKVVDDDLKHIAGFEGLNNLNLALTKITDDGVQHITKLKNLTYLNLYGSEVSDRSATYLKDLEKLTKLFLWNSKFTQKGVDKVKKSLPKTDISFGG
jgi:hypothetical protein